MTDSGTDRDDEVLKAVDRRRARRRHWERHGERPLWKNLSMVGALGWLIVVPTLAALYVGRWLDSLLGTGVMLSGALTALGACFGLILVWLRMNQE